MQMLIDFIGGEGGDLYFMLYIARLHGEVGSTSGCRSGDCKLKSQLSHITH